MKRKLFALILSLLSVTSLMAAVPTEEGLLKNVNNQDLQGSNVVLKFSIQPVDESTAVEFMKVYLQQENENNFGMLQVIYSNAQMLDSQILNIRYTPNVLMSLRSEKNMDKALFTSSLAMLALNNPYAFKVTMAKNGITVASDRDILNGDKINLLKEYKTYLVNNKGRSEAGSPFNSQDAKVKDKNIEIFKSNTFKRAENIELVKKNNEFMWKIDWKGTQVFFSNEQREFKVLEHSATDGQFKIDANNYLAFNGINSFPKFLSVKETQGQIVKLQTLSLEVKKTEKKLKDLYQEHKGSTQEKASAYSFIF